MQDQIITLRKRNLELVALIDKAQSAEDADTQIQLKRELYNNKLKMLDLISIKEQKLTITARQLRDKVNKLKPAIRYETGVYALDQELSGGFEVGSLIQLAGASGSGKTTLFLEIVSNVAKYAKTFFGNFEMGDRRIVKRLGYLLKQEKQWDNLLINADSRNLDDLIMEITLLANEGVVFFAIDSRMKLHIKSVDAEYQRIAMISERLSECAIKNDIIILMINQISEDDLKNKRLQFKGSGNQMYDTDMALFIVVAEDQSRTLVCTKSRQDEKLFNIPLIKSCDPIKVEIVYDEKFEMSVL